MLRKIAILPIIMALSMMTLVTIFPHHHHQTMVCFVREICCLDGCCDDEHTQHHDANSEEDESHCVAHEQYVPSEHLQIEAAVSVLDWSQVYHFLLLKEDNTGRKLGNASEFVPFVEDPPVLSSAGANAPPLS